MIIRLGLLKFSVPLSGLTSDKDQKFPGARLAACSLIFLAKGPEENRPFSLRLYFYPNFVKICGVLSLSFMRLLKILLPLFLIAQMVVFTPAFAQENFSLETIEFEAGSDGVIAEEEVFKAVIQAKDNVEAGKNIIFDGSKSYSPDPEEKLIYEWHFGDGNWQRGVEVVHSFKEPGEYQVQLKVRNSKDEEAVTETTVFVFERSFLLITDKGDEQERISALLSYAREQGVYVELIESFASTSEFISEENLTQKLTESLEDIQKTDQLVIWTQGTSGLTVLSRFKKALIDRTLAFADKEILVVTNQNLSTFANIAQGTFNTVLPKRIILTRSESLWPLVDALNIDQFLATIKEREIDFRMIDRRIGVNLTNFMSYLINFMLDRGVPSNSLMLILMLPVIVTIVALMKQVIGMTTLGVYIPSIIALSFLALGLKFGLLILLIILFFGTLSRLVLSKYRLLYIPRMAIVLTIVSVTILLMLLMGAYFNISQLVVISIFPMLIMSTLVEKFVSIQTEKGLKSALLIIIETILVSVTCYYVAEWNYLKTLMLGHPELIFVFLIIDVILGRWAGLRLFEFIRFREIFRHSGEE